MRKIYELKKYKNKVYVLLVVLLIFILGVPLVGQYIRVFIYKNKIDPLVLAISKSFGSEKLLPGSKLEEWIKILREPDLVIHSDEKYVSKTTQFFWLSKGVGISIYGWINLKDLDNNTGRKVISVLLPLKKKLAKVEYASNWYVKLSKYKFKNVTDISLGNIKLSNFTPARISMLYEYWNPSSRTYSVMPDYISKYRIHLYLSNENATVKRNIYYTDSIQIITINYFDHFNLLSYSG